MIILFSTIVGVLLIGVAYILIKKYRARAFDGDDEG